MSNSFRLQINHSMVGFSSNLRQPQQPSALLLRLNQYKKALKTKYFSFDSSSLTIVDCRFSGDTLDGLQYVNQTGCSSSSSLFPNGMQFTTIDSDNDHYDSGCASRMGGGWWYNMCSAGCLTCKTGSFVWLDATNGCTNLRRLAEARMMMKPQ